MGSSAIFGVKSVLKTLYLKWVGGSSNVMDIINFLQRVVYIKLNYV